MNPVRGLQPHRWLWNIWSGDFGKLRSRVVATPNCMRFLAPVCVSGLFLRDTWAESVLLLLFASLPCSTHIFGHADVSHVICVVYPQVHWPMYFVHVQPHPTCVPGLMYLQTLHFYGFFYLLDMLVICWVLCRLGSRFWTPNLWCRSQISLLHVHPYFHPLLALSRGRGLFVGMGLLVRQVQVLASLLAVLTNHHLCMHLFQFMQLMPHGQRHWVQLWHHCFCLVYPVVRCSLRVIVVLLFGFCGRNPALLIFGSTIAHSLLLMFCTCAPSLFVGSHVSRIRCVMVLHVRLSLVGPLHWPQFPNVGCFMLTGCLWLMSLWNGSL